MNNVSCNFLWLDAQSNDDEKWVEEKKIMQRECILYLVRKNKLKILIFATRKRECQDRRDNDENVRIARDVKFVYINISKLSSVDDTLVASVQSIAPSRRAIKRTEKKTVKIVVA